MRSTQERVGERRTTAAIIHISALYAAARQVARRRNMDWWLAAGVVGVLWTFVVAFAWKVLSPAMSTLIG